MSFFQKNKTIITILLMAGFFIAILLIFVSGISGADSNPTPVVNVQPQQSVLATSTGNVPSAPLSGGTPQPSVSSGTLDTSPDQAITESAPQLSDSSTAVQSPAAGGGAVTNTPLPPAADDVNEEPTGTDFPPPLTFVPLPTETPPPGNGPPPGS